MSIHRGRRLPFVVLPWAVLEHRSLTATDVLVYATIARFADNRTGEAYPSRATIAGLARSSVDTVDRSIRILEQAGFLTKERRKGPKGEPASNLYVVHEIAEAAVEGGSRTHAARGGRADAASGSRTDAARTTPTELDTGETPIQASEWTLPPADVTAMMVELGLKETTP
jgi:hypothetical protein